MRAIMGIDSSERYDSSAAIKTTCLPLPGPSPPEYVSHSSRVPKTVGGQQTEQEQGNHYNRLDRIMIFQPGSRI